MRNIIKNVRVGNLEFDLAVVPHPSGQNNWLWRKMSFREARDTMESVRSRILELLT